MKIKPSIIILLFLLVSQVNAQSIQDLFRLIPLRNYGEIGYISNHEKDSLVRTMPVNDSEISETSYPYYLMESDKNNGYIRIGSSLCSCYIEMCMWSIPDYQDSGIPVKIVAVAYTSYDTHGGLTDYIDYFLYKNKTLFLLDDCLKYNYICAHFYKDGIDEEKQSCQLVYELPRYGRNIKVRFALPDGSDSYEYAQELLPKLKADALEITVDEQGNFRTVRSYWSDNYMDNKEYWDNLRKAPR